MNREETKEAIKVMQHYVLNRFPPKQPLTPEQVSRYCEVLLSNNEILNRCLKDFGKDEE